jgi:uncharacterized protein (DUF362 family)
VGIGETDLIVFQKNDILTSANVALSSGHHGYPLESPYSPGVAYPEYPFASTRPSTQVNHVYEGVRNALELLGLDAQHCGEPRWNPLGEIVHPGDTVILKPNFIRNFRETQSGHGDCLITHGSIIRAALDYVYIALRGEGRIIIADAPQDDADFEAIRRITGLDQIQEFYHGQGHCDVEVYDLRPEKSRTIDGVTIGHRRLPGDPRGYITVDLGSRSMCAEIEHLCHLFYGTEYDTNEIRRHQTGGVHEYLISQTVLQADCVVNLPKLKTHKKTGITVCMKNLVGINGNKNWLPHHRLGTPAQGGDQFADDGWVHRIERNTMACFRRLFPLLGPVRRILAKPLKAMGQHAFGDTNTDTIRSGNWYGNDTTWRMVVDLNRVLIYADKKGHLQDTPARHVFCLVDGIIGGEGNGPLDPTPKASSLIIAGANPVAVDLACARVMGFDYERLPLLRQAFRSHALPLTSFMPDEVTYNSTDSHGDRPLADLDAHTLHFKPHFGWQRHVELDGVNIVRDNRG